MEVSNRCLKCLVLKAFKGKGKFIFHKHVYCAHIIYKFYQVKTKIILRSGCLEYKRLYIFKDYVPWDVLLCYCQSQHNGFLKINLQGLFMFSRPLL